MAQRQVRILVSIVTGLLCLAIDSSAQLDQEKAYQMAEEINKFRFWHLRSRLSYAPEYQASCDSMIKRKPSKHLPFIKGQVGEIFMGYNSDIRGWKGSPGHREVMLMKEAHRVCVGAFKDEDGDWWHVARFYGKPKEKKP